MKKQIPDSNYTTFSFALMKILPALVAVASLLPSSLFALEWEIDMPFENTIFPSMVVGLRGFSDSLEMGDTEFGDPMGMIGVKITAPEDDYEVKVVLAATDFFKESTITATLAKEGETYTLMPIIRYYVSDLLAHKQKGFDNAHITVETPDEILEKTKRFDVRSINDCLLGMTKDDEFVNLRFMFAAYVNENNPILDKILGAVLDKEYVDSFIGYQGTRGDVVDQVAAIYQTLQDMGFKYSSITGASGISETIYTQHIRFIGEALDTNQANCVDGTVLMASLFMKIGLNPVIITVPGHAFVGVYKSDASELEFLVPIETTVVGSSTYEEAVEIASDYMDKNLENFADLENESYGLIDVREFRKLGIEPIPELQE